VVRASTNQIFGNRIGTDIDGTEALPNEQNGVLIDGASFTIIGGPNKADGNLISGNKLNGVLVTGNNALLKCPSGERHS
jgi:hypothetical protein